ncbi:MAG: diaminopimelate epimerase [Gammaproteobacteria bacterium]|nr:diaminopimelate epimerase [Gammaproteobacteria bacterium]
MLKFSKMHGLGNDFVVIDAINQGVTLTAPQIRFLSDRRRGVGCDQLLLVETSNVSGCDFKYRIFNADGGEVAQCGNGARCFARYVRDKGLTDKDTISVETASGIIYPTLNADGNVTVDMGLPRFVPEQIPFITEQQADSYSLMLDDEQTITIGAVSMGNPHAVMLVNDIAGADVATLGPMIERHARFPERVNAGFMQIVTPKHIHLRVYERGAGETQACGTGACAAVVSGIKRGLLARNVTVSLPGGELTIVWSDNNSSVLMTGSATHVFDGEMSWAMINTL